MSNKEKDIDEGIDFSEKGFNKRFKRIERPAFLDKIRNNPLPDTKSRITIYLDADIVEHYKQIAAQSGAGYQTLINHALRQTVEAENVLPEYIKESLLKDTEFLNSLKTALAE